MKKTKQRLVELENRINNNNRKKDSDMILLFIAQTITEVNSNIKWLMAIAGAAIAILIALAIGG